MSDCSDQSTKEVADARNDIVRLCMMMGVLIHVSSWVGWMRGEELGDARTVAERFDHGVKSTA